MRKEVTKQVSKRTMMITEQPLGIWPLKCSLCNQWFCYIPWSNELYHISLLGLLCTNINTDKVHLVSLLRDLSFWYCGQLLAGYCLEDHTPHKSLRPWDYSGLLWAETCTYVPKVCCQRENMSCVAWEEKGLGSLCWTSLYSTNTYLFPVAFAL